VHTFLRRSPARDRVKMLSAIPKCTSSRQAVAGARNGSRRAASACDGGEGLVHVQPRLLDGAQPLGDWPNARRVVRHPGPARAPRQHPGPGPAKARSGGMCPQSIQRAVR